MGISPERPFRISLCVREFMPDLCSGGAKCGALGEQEVPLSLTPAEVANTIELEQN
jgi:hypothetical protein